MVPHGRPCTQLVFMDPLGVGFRHPPNDRFITGAATLLTRSCSPGSETWVPPPPPHSPTPCTSIKGPCGLYSMVFSGFLRGHGWGCRPFPIPKRSLGLVRARLPDCEAVRNSLGAVRVPPRLFWSGWGACPPFANGSVGVQFGSFLEALAFGTL